MDLANVGHAPNGGVVDSDKTIRRRKKVQMAPQGEAVHGFPERQGGSVASRQQQQEVDEGLVSSSLPKSDAGTTEQNSSLPSHHPPAEKGQKKSKEAVELADIAKDLSKIKRQNTITHVLLGAVIVMTAVWQVNEMSFLLWAQKKLSNPLKSLGDLIKGSLRIKGRKPAVIESSPLPPVGVPDVTRTDLPSFVISGDHR